MIYKKFIIENFKAIEKVEIDVNKEIIPLIGINESGKTSILQGILAFDKTKDNILDSVHIDVKNRYNTKQNVCILKAQVELEDEEEFDEIGKALKINMETPIYDWLKDKLESKNCITLQRDFNNGKLLKTYSLVDEEENIIKAPKNKNLVKEFVNRLPSILYFDDFSDRVPSNVQFPEDYVITKKLSRGKIREWQEIIQEIFSRAIDEEFSLSTFMKLDDEDDKSNYLEDVKAILDEEIISEWKNLKSNFSKLADDSVNLEIKLTYDNHENKFTFKIKDSESGKGRHFDIQQRSKGFQWFFNFIMKLKFNPKYKENPKDAIYLLDEPGSYLHSSAQTELLKKLCSIGKDNTIIYCTHSQYLLDPDVINIGSIKIVSKEAGFIKITNYGESKYIKNMGAFSPLYHALQIKYGFSNNNLKKCILTEGITDYYFYKMFLDLGDIEIIPGHGCTQLKELISLLISFSDSFLVILDNDAEGRKAYNTYKRYFKDSFENNNYMYDLNKKGNFVLEDLLSKNNKEQIKTVSQCDNIKDAITVLYFMSKDEKTKTINNFDNTTKKYLNIIKNKIRAHFKQPNG